MPRKKVIYSYGSLRISQLTKFKNRSFESGQGVVQFEPNIVWSIHCVCEVKMSRFCYNLRVKKVRFSYGNLRHFVYGYFLFRSVVMEHQFHWLVLTVEQDDVRIIGENSEMWGNKSYLDKMTKTTGHQVSLLKDGKLRCYKVVKQGTVDFTKELEELKRSLNISCDTDDGCAENAESASQAVEKEKSKEPEHCENVMVYFQALSNSISFS